MTTPTAETPGTPAWKNPVVVIGTVVFVVAAIITVRYVEQRFNTADVRNGVEIVQGYRAHNGRLLQDVLRARHDGLPRSALRWEGESISTCYQYVRVRAVVTERNGRTVQYAFDVDINTVSIHPGNELGLAALRDLSSPAGGGSSKVGPSGGNGRPNDP